MAFRCGINGHELWEDCWEHQVAIIEYGPFDDIDLSLYPRGEPKSAWAELRGSQSHSLKRFVYQMDKDDIIYVKRGPMIVAKGIVAGPYRFDKKNRIVDPEGTPWQHQRHVRWTRYVHDIPVQIGYAQYVTLVPLDARDVKRVEKAAKASGN
ncbi:MAG: hypothetical protein KJ000_27080 [Pirellulaceae bacterium]|nr:hypothetical protein [Pirellulaceae bacterium]